MLVLSRRQGEEICVDGDVTIRVLKVRGRRVRLGISAPPKIRVLRKELLARYPVHDGESLVQQLRSGAIHLGT